MRSYRNPKTKIKRGNEETAGNRLRDLPEWFEEFAENPEDAGELASRDTLANTSHDSDSGRPTKVGIEKALYLYSLPERPKLRNTQENQDYKGSLQEDALVMQYLEQTTFGDLTLTDPTRTRGKISCHSMDSLLSVQNQDFSGDGKADSFSSRRKCRKSSIQKILWNVANPVKNHHGIIVHQRLTDQKQIGLLRERCATLEEELLQCRCNQA